MMGSSSPSSVNDTVTGHSVFGPDAWSGISNRLHLSPRELEITQAVFDDEKEDEIAHRLGISAHTVHTHFTRLYHKLDINSRAQLVVRILAASRRDGR